MRKPYASKRPKLNLSCPVCGVYFSRYASEVRHNRPTCSLSCARSLTPSKKKTRVVLDCERCGDAFSVVKTREDTARFCSKTCKDETLKGESHPCWKGGDQRSWALRALSYRLVKERGACEICGETQKLHAHHIKSRRDFPDLAMEEGNILVVCPPCHANQHPELAAFLLGGHA